MTTDTKDPATTPVRMPMPTDERRKERWFLEGPKSRQSEFGVVLSIVREFIRGFRVLHFVGPCVTVFGSARFKEEHPYYELARKVGGGIMLFHDTKQITRDKIEAIILGFRDPTSYFASLSPSKREEYTKYYKCQNVDMTQAFGFRALHDGLYPSFLDKK